MLTLLAESKTMAADQLPVSTQEFDANLPIFEDTADQIMKYVESLPLSQLAQTLGISNQLAGKAHDLAYDFLHKLTGYKAIFGFTGEAYRGLQASSLSSEALGRAQDSLRIISSVYGILKPYDIIKPYRCEFNKKICPGEKTPIQVFKSKNTMAMVNFIKLHKIEEIIDLLPGDADKCIDWKIVRAFTSVNKICFQVLTPQGKLKTPIASRLKELRGRMARLILSEGISTFKELCSFQSEHFIFSKADSKPGLPVFISD